MKELKAPPGKRVFWWIQSKAGIRFIVSAQTAFEAAEHCGLKLSDTRDTIRWADLRVLEEQRHE